MTEHILGHEVVGAGQQRLVVMNDWLCDTSTWQSARAYLDTSKFSWCFADLRGYGRSRGHKGSFTVTEAAGDVLALADWLGWQRFAIVGHSMSTYVAMHLGQHWSARVEKVVLITPGPPRGFGADAAWLESAQATTRDEAKRSEAVRARFAGRLSPGWGEYKRKRWLAVSDPDAAAAYVAMYARDGLPTPEASVDIPVLAVTGEEDAPAMRQAAVLEEFAPLCSNLEVTALIQCGHYPMEEMPPLTVSTVELFCSK
jgi:pimeloyl-ACP methyl ester carboxylesterase